MLLDTNTRYTFLFSCVFVQVQMIAIIMSARTGIESETEIEIEMATETEMVVIPTTPHHIRILRILRMITLRRATGTITLVIMDHLLPHLIVTLLINLALLDHLQEAIMSDKAVPEAVLTVRAVTRIKIGTENENEIVIVIVTEMATEKAKVKVKVTLLLVALSYCEKCTRF